MKARIANYLPTSVILVFLFVVLCLINTVSAEQINNNEQRHESDFSFASLVEPLGACALGSLVVTFGSGLFRKKLRRRFIKIHTIFAWLTIIFALCHGVLVAVLF